MTERGSAKMARPAWRHDPGAKRRGGLCGCPSGSTGHKADSRFLGFILKRRVEQRSETLDDFAKDGIVFEQFFVDLGETPQDAEIGGDLLAHLNEGTNNEHAHGDRMFAAQNHRSHNGSVLGKNPGKVLFVLTL